MKFVMSEIKKEFNKSSIMALSLEATCNLDHDGLQIKHNVRGLVRKRKHVIEDRTHLKVLL